MRNGRETLRKSAACLDRQLRGDRNDIHGLAARHLREDLGEHPDRRRGQDQHLILPLDPRDPDREPVSAGQGVARRRLSPRPAGSPRRSVRGDRCDRAGWTSESPSDEVIFPNVTTLEYDPDRNKRNGPDRVSSVTAPTARDTARGRSASRGAGGDAAMSQANHRHGAGVRCDDLIEKPVPHECLAGLVTTTTQSGRRLVYSTPVR